MLQIEKLDHMLRQVSFFENRDSDTIFVISGESQMCTLSNFRRVTHEISWLVSIEQH